VRHEGTVKERDRLHCGLPNGHGREKAQKAQEGKPLSSALSPLRRTGGKILRLLSFLAAKVHDGWRIFQQEITEVIPIRNRDSLFALFAPGQISSPRRPRPGRLPDSESGSLPANSLSVLISAHPRFNSFGCGRPCWAWCPVLRQIGASAFP